jgi:hypothetical protein
MISDLTVEGWYCSRISKKTVLLFYALRTRKTILLHGKLGGLESVRTLGDSTRPLILP